MDVKRAKFAKQLMEEIASLIQMEIKDPRLEGLVITGLELSEDMSVAKVYFTTLEEGKEEEAKKALEHAKGYIRSQLMKSLRVKRSWRKRKRRISSLTTLTHSFWRRSAVLLGRSLFWCRLWS